MFKIITNYFREILSSNLENKIINSLINSNLDLLFSIDILIENGSYKGVEELTRCYIETYFQVIFIMKKDSLISNKILAYEYFVLKNRLEIPNLDKLAKAIKEHYEEYLKKSYDLQEIRNSLNEIISTEGILKDKDKLNLAKYKLIRKEIKRLKQKDKAKNFYECFCENKIKNIRDLAVYIKYENYYILHYYLYSKKIHNIDPFEKINIELVKKTIVEITIDILKEYFENILKKTNSDYGINLLILKCYFNSLSVETLKKLKNDIFFKKKYINFIEKYS